MCIPAVGATDGCQTVVAPAPPATSIHSGQLQRLLQGAEVGDIHQAAIGAALQNLARTAIIGGHQRQAAGRGLQQGEPEGLGERRVHEHPTQPSRPAVQGRHLIAAMLLGVGNTTVKIETVDEFEQLLKQLTLRVFQGAGIVATTEHEHKIVALPQQG